MKKILAIAVAAMAFSMIAPQSDLSAQTYQDSYRFGAGLNYGHAFPFPNQGRRARGNFFNLGGIGFSRRVEAPPYFAQYPPVHYSGVVARPYGFSPYALPPGIMPAEMMVPAQPAKKIENPYYEPEGENPPPADAPVPADTPPIQNTSHKVTSILNPYFGALTIR